MVPTKEVGGRRTYLEDLIGALGPENVDISGKTKCCGFPVLAATRKPPWAWWPSMPASRRGTAPTAW